MQIKDLESVMAVYRYKSFSSAAEMTNFSVSTISKQISKIENELNVKLFIRKTKHSDIVITPEGEILIPAIQAILDEYTNLEYLVDNINGTDITALTIGHIPMIGTMGETEIIYNFTAENPDIQIDYVNGSDIELLNLLRSGEIDGAFILVPSVVPNNLPMIEALLSSDLQFEVVMRNSRAFIGMSEDHPFAGRSSVRIEELKDEVFLFTNLQDFGQYDSRIYQLQNMISEKTHKMKIRFMDFTNKDVVLSLVERGKAILPQLVMPLSRGHKVKYVEIENWPDEAAGLFVFRKTSRSRAMRNFVRCVKAYADMEKAASKN